MNTFFVHLQPKCAFQPDCLSNELSFTDKLVWSIACPRGCCRKLGDLREAGKRSGWRRMCAVCTAADTRASEFKKKKKKDLDLRAPANAPGTGDPMTGMFLKTSSIMLNGFSRCLCSPAEKEGVPMPNHWDHFYISPNWLRHSENCLSIVAECFDS